MLESGRQRLFVVAAFAIPLILFVSQPSCLWNFDGVACAAALELGNPAYLFHIQHLLYGFLGFLFWKVLALPLGMSRALPALQLFTSILSAVALAGLYVALQRSTKDRVVALLMSATMGTTAVVWVWSVEAQVYALGFLGLSWATAALFQPDSPRKWMWVGLLQGIAILGHLMHFLWCIPALYWIMKGNSSLEARRHQAMTYLGILTIAVLIPYALAFFFAVKPNLPGDMQLSNWLKGSLGLTPDRRIAWHWSGGNTPGIWLKATASFFWGNLWPYGPAHTKAEGLLFGLSALSLLTAAGTALRTRWDKLKTFCLLWIASYALLFWTWEPATLCYRMSEAIPFGLWFATGLMTISQKWLRYGLASLALTSTLFLTLFSQIMPMTREQNNILFSRTKALAAATPAQSLYLTMGTQEWIYLLYFTGRASLNLPQIPDGKSEAQLMTVLANVPVYVEASALHNEREKRWLSKFKQRPIAEGLPWLQVL